MKILGVDYGLRRVGVAISSGEIVQTLPVIHVVSPKDALYKLNFLIDKQQVTKVILGLPSPDKIGVEKFAKKLGQISNIPIEFRDETLTSQLSFERLREQRSRKKRQRIIDSFSAALLLQEVLDEKKQL